MRRRWSVLLAAALLSGVAVPETAHAQEDDTPPPLEVGAVAPDFELPGATRWGVLADPVRLSDFEDKVVVLSFFFRARTRG